MKIKYFKQQTRTDCLLTAAENFVQRPREKFGKLKWFNRQDEQYLRYSSFAKILNKNIKGVKAVFNGVVELTNEPAILGIVLRINENTVCHSLFWDGKAAFCPSRGQFIDLSELDVVYCFLHPNIQHFNSHKDIQKICAKWDKNCLNPKTDLTGKVENLITIKYKEKMYPGNLERANINREYNYEKI